MIADSLTSERNPPKRPFSIGKDHFASGRTEGRGCWPTEELMFMMFMIVIIHFTVAVARIDDWNR